MSDLRQWLKTKQLRQPGGKIPNHAGPLRAVMCIIHTSPPHVMFGTVSGHSMLFDCFAKLSIPVEELIVSVDNPELVSHFTLSPDDVSTIDKMADGHTNVELYEQGALHAWYLENRRQRTLT